MTELVENVSPALAQDLATPWWSWPEVRRALLRGAVLGPMAIAIGGRPENVVWAWVPILLALFEAWAARRERSGRQVVALVSAAFLLGTVGLLAVWFQLVHVRALINEGSLDAALRAVAAEPAELLSMGSVKHPPPLCVPVVYFAQVGALALAAPLVVRLRRSDDGILTLLFLVAVAPLADWVILAALGRCPWSAGVFAVSAFSSVLLGCGAVIAIPVVLVLTSLCDVADRRLARA